MIVQSVCYSGLFLNTALPFYCLWQTAVWHGPERCTLTQKTHNQRHTVPMLLLKMGYHGEARCENIRGHCLHTHVHVCNCVCI